MTKKQTFTRNQYTLCQSRPAVHHRQLFLHEHAGGYLQTIREVFKLYQNSQIFLQGSPEVESLRLKQEWSS